MIIHRQHFSYLLAVVVIAILSSPTSIVAFTVAPKTSSLSTLSVSIMSKSDSSLNMVKTRGLEIQKEGATPTPGGMTLYIKAGPDKTSVGDCPFAHYVRMVLIEKELPYDVIPSVQETKPDWLIDYYDGAMPALRHRKECYVDSDVIVQYLDFFFPNNNKDGDDDNDNDNAVGLGSYGKKDMNAAKESVEGFFPAVAKYLKHTTNGNEDDLVLKQNLEEVLGKLNVHLSDEEHSGPYLVGNGDKMTELDCSLAPKLYHLSVGLNAFKDNAVDIEGSFPAVNEYMTTVFDRPSFKEASYPEETVVWGWTNART